jgi:hypothetical protein
MYIFALCTLLVTAAHADDGWDIDIDDIQLDDSSTKGKELVTYTGAENQSAPDFAEGASVTITHSGGTISVRCLDRKGISARLNYTLEGTNRNALSAFGKGLGLRAWGGATNGGVQTRIPGASSSIKSKDLPLVVSLPSRARVRINGGSGWVQVTGCEGTVAAANRSGDIAVDGNYSNISITAARGDVDVSLTEDATLSGTNRIQAPGGTVKLALPMSYGGRIYARSAQVDVRHMVDGTESPTQVQGKIGDGNASLSITAKTEIKVTTPDGF